ncbi:MAG: N-acetyl-1-D-myo-inositol-2-amino-2-deoxy-alpha-D-glucopyranoside deacetylase [Kineosporiaceae bacterium]
MTLPDPAGAGLVPKRRLLLVHAHPDDETITTGATMGHHAATGAHVCLVTCTRGEQGEVIPPQLAHLSGAALGAHREGELAAAMRELGVSDHRFLGAASGVRFLDSGMALDGAGGVVLPEDVVAGAFALADVDLAAELLAAVIDEVRPQAVITYDPSGGYGHPDHVQAHRVTMRAVELARWPVARVYWIVVPASAMAAERVRLAEPDNPFAAWPDDAPSPGVVADDQVSALIDGHAVLDRKAAALRAHATQVSVQRPFFALSNDLGQLIAPIEYYHLAQGGPLPDGEPLIDLFAGLDGDDLSE